MKIFLFLLGLFLAVCFIAYGVLAYFLDSMVVNGVNTFGSKLTQTKVELVSAKLSPLTGSGTLTGFSVDNPKGWAPGRAFYLGEVKVDVSPLSLVREPVVINEITIDQPEFTYETTLLSSNIKDLLKNIEQFTGKSGATKEDPAGKGRKFVLKKFRLTHGKATVGAAGNAVQVTLPTISLDDIGVAEGGITGEQLAAVLTKKLLASLAAGSTNALTSGELSVDQLKESAKKAGDSLKKMFERK